MDRGGQQRHVPARDAGAHGPAAGRARHRVGPQPGAPHHDPLQDRQHPRPLRPQGARARVCIWDNCRPWCQGCLATALHAVPPGSHTQCMQPRLPVCPWPPLTTHTCLDHQTFAGEPGCCTQQPHLPSRLVMRLCRNGGCWTSNLPSYRASALAAGSGSLNSWLCSRAPGCRAPGVFFSPSPCVAACCAATVALCVLSQ